MTNSSLNQSKSFFPRLKFVYILLYSTLRRESIMLDTNDSKHLKSLFLVISESF